LPGARSAETDTADPKALVARGYDQMALRYASWKVEGNPAMRFVRELDSRLRAGSDVIELGCGRGVPVARELAKRHRVTGVDISAAQIELARHHVPEAAFLHTDYTELEVAPRSVDAVVAILTLTHVPRDEHADLLGRIAVWLRDGGFLLCSFGVDDAPDSIEDDWLGVPMFFSHFDARTNLRLVADAGLDVVLEEIVPMHEEGHGEARFLWVIAKKGQ
jgi:cyclopropane fatty-acyl-phospholipid synthase-like methyltransferase